jgi:hypothetical protein
MAGINITPDEFPGIVASFLLDAMMNDKILTGNEEFNTLIDKIKSSTKPSLLNYYMTLDAIERSKYKAIQKSFIDGGQSSIVINGEPEKKVPVDKHKTIKYIIKKVLSLIKSEKLRKNNGMPINEEKVDRIIQYVLDKEIE